MNLPFKYVISLTVSYRKFIGRMSRNQMPPALMAKFFEGVEERPDDDRDWEVSFKQRPARLGLGADPKSIPKTKQTNTERRITNMVRRQNDDSSSDSDSDENVRSHL